MLGQRQCKVHCLTSRHVANCMDRKHARILEVHNPLTSRRLIGRETAARHQLERSMTRNPLKDGNISENSLGIGTVTRKMVRGRAEELATINGDWLHKASASDFEHARQQLTGEPDIAPQTATLESAPESERWDSVAGSTGHKLPVPSNDDEDEEGRSDNQRLVEEGIAGAEHDQMLQAARAAASADVP
jgi:hypothetical protein